MMHEDSSLWRFERVDPGSSGISGKVGDLFRNEELESRGHLVAGAPSSAATLMAREVIQNSWDAADELRRLEPTISPFSIDFLFQERIGSARANLIEALGLRELASHARTVAASPDERQKILGLGVDDCLLHLDDGGDVRCCEIVEHGASGMSGPWKGAESRMFLAMLALGYNKKAAGSGGTFGYGKAGLIRASASRIVLAYSCFRPHPDDPATRRLLGVAYWGQHTLHGSAFNGFARFGLEVDGGPTVAPFVDERADDVARSLGLRVRDPNVTMELGTTFLVIDPVVQADELVTAVERNWWPALLDEKFTVLIERPDGSPVACRPRTNKSIASYVRAYDLLETGSPAEDDTSFVREIPTYQPEGHDRMKCGTVALVAEPQGWSFPDEDAETPDGATESRSLVALTRDPRMVVEYHLPGRDISRRMPYVRGVFVSDADVNDLLSRTEPKAHDKWDTQQSDDVELAATKVATHIANAVKDAVRAFQAQLRPPVDASGAVKLQRLDEKLRKLQTGGGPKPPPPPPGDRPFSFRIDVGREVTEGALVLSGSIEARLSSATKEDELPARVRIAYALDEDGRRGESVPLAVTLPKGFAPVEGESDRFDGILSREPVVFELRSNPYSADRTADLLISGDRHEAGEDSQ